MIQATQARTDTEPGTQHAYTLTVHAVAVTHAGIFSTILYH